MSILPCRRADDFAKLFAELVNNSGPYFKFLHVLQGNTHSKNTDDPSEKFFGSPKQRILSSDV